jgi:hypothetical protein
MHAQERLTAATPRGSRASAAEVSAATAARINTRLPPCPRLGLCSADDAPKIAVASSGGALHLDDCMRA